MHTSAHPSSSRDDTSRFGVTARLEKLQSDYDTFVLTDTKLTDRERIHCIYKHLCGKCGQDDRSSSRLQMICGYCHDCKMAELPSTEGTKKFLQTFCQVLVRGRLPGVFADRLLPMYAAGLSPGASGRNPNKGARTQRYQQSPWRGKRN